MGPRAAALVLLGFTACSSASPSLPAGFCPEGTSFKLYNLDDAPPPASPYTARAWVRLPWRYAQCHLPDGTQHGWSITWLYGGALRTEGLFVRGVRQGRWVMTDREGHLLREERFEGSEATSCWKTYYEDGRPSGEGCRKDGLPDGAWRVWATDGRLLGEGTLRGGTGRFAAWEDLGGAWDDWPRHGDNKWITGAYWNGRQDGTWLWWWDGKVSWKAVYDQGKTVFEGYP